MSKAMTCGRNAANTIRLSTRDPYMTNARVTVNAEMEHPDCSRSADRGLKDSNILIAHICDMSQSQFMNNVPTGSVSPAGMESHYGTSLPKVTEHQCDIDGMRTPVTHQIT